MLFDNKIQKHDITYTYEDPKMINYLEQILNINDKYHNKFIELRENMDAVRNTILRQDENYQLYAECVYKFFGDTTEEFCNLSEEINEVYDKFINIYSTLSESENFILENMTNILHEQLFFNGYLYDTSLKNINLEEDMLLLDNNINSLRELRMYMEDINYEDHYKIIRGKILNLNERFTEEEFQDIVYNSMLLYEGEVYSARLTTKEKEFLLEAVLNNEGVTSQSNNIMNSINKHYRNVISYFNEMSNLELENVDQCIAQHILVENKIVECMNVLSMYNDVLGVYINTVNKQNNEYNNFLHKQL